MAISRRAEKLLSKTGSSTFIVTSCIAYQTAFMDEFMLDDQSGRADNFVFSGILNDGHVVVATALHLSKTLCRSLKIRFQLYRFTHRIQIASY